MFKKSFVSVAFSTKALQVVKLNSSKKKIEKHVSVELPDGLVANHKVQDTNALSKIIKGVWKKLNIKEKSVGIVVPEFSTFVKLLELPELELSELNEAVDWQVQDFLPKNTKDMTMDWKIIEKLGQGYKVLTTSMDREILYGFVEAVGKAGLYPILVETPSLTLSRLSGKEKQGKLVIYQYFEETILVITKNGDAIVSSVIASHDVSDIIDTTKKLIEHYKDVEVSEILIGGIGINDSLPNEVAGKLGIDVKPIKVSVEGLSAVDLHKYLIPLSLQYRTPSDPDDMDSINLLPVEIVKKYRNKRLHLRVYSLMMLTTFLVWISFIASVGTYIYLNQQIKSYKQSNASSLNVIQETEDARNKIKQINSLSSLVLKINRAKIPPQIVFNSIEEAKIDGIQINRYKMELDRAEVELTGNAAERGDLISFKQNLENDELFEEVIVPISYLEVERDINFSLTMRVTQD